MAKAETFWACVTCANYIEGIDMGREYPGETERGVVQQIEHYALSVNASGRVTHHNSFHTCRFCGDRTIGERRAFDAVYRVPSLPSSLPAFAFHRMVGRRIYESLGLTNNVIPRDLTGTFQVDGYDFEVTAPNKQLHRVFLRFGASRIPFGRIGQASFLLLAHHGGEPEGLYCRQVTECHFELYDVHLWENLDSSAIPTHGRYNVQSGHVRLDQKTHATKQNALRYMGMGFAPNGDIGNEVGELIARKNTFAHSLVLVQSLWAYGEKDIACDVSGNNLRKLIKQACNAL